MDPITFYRLINEYSTRAGSVTITNRRYTETLPDDISIENRAQCLSMSNARRQITSQIYYEKTVIEENYDR